MSTTFEPDCSQVGIQVLQWGCSPHLQVQPELALSGRLHAKVIKPFLSGRLAFNSCDKFLALWANGQMPGHAAF